MQRLQTTHKQYGQSLLDHNVSPLSTTAASLHQLVDSICVRISNTLEKFISQHSNVNGQKQLVKLKPSEAPDICRVRLMWDTYLM